MIGLRTHCHVNPVLLTSSHPTSIMAHLVFPSSTLSNVLHCKQSCALNCAKKNGRVDTVDEDSVDRVIKGMKLVVAIHGVALMDWNPVWATERAWKPRRHNRRLGEQYLERPFQNPEPKTKQKIAKVSNTYERTPGKIKVKNYQISRKSPRRQYSFEELSAPMPRWISTSRRHVPEIGIALIAVFVLWKLIQKISSWTNAKPWWRTQTGTKGAGRWIHDRSLGGKEIFVHRTETNLNPLGEETNRLSDPPHAATIHKSEPLPHWWCPPVTIHVPEDIKAQARIEAKKLLRHLEDSRFSANDYSFDVIVQLYRCCMDACIVMKPSTDSIARSLYSYAIKQTIMLISEGIGGPSGTLPTEFISRLAYVMDLNTSEAAKIVHNETSAKTRSLILQIFADVRGTGHSTYTLRSLVSLLRTLPIPESNAELVGSSITSTTTEQERIEMYALLTQTSPDLTHLSGKLLGKVE